MKKMTINTEELRRCIISSSFSRQLGKEDGYFNINDIVKFITEKMIRRHPHVFGDTEVNNTSEVLDNWDKN